MKIEYLVFEQLNNYSGVKKKINDQVMAFNRFGGVTCNLTVFGRKSKILDKLLVRFPYFSHAGSWSSSLDLSDVSCIYIRLPGFNFQFLMQLRRIKKTNSKIIIIIEIPTYPYDKQLSQRVLDIPLLIKDKISRNFLRRRVDYFVTYSQDDLIFGVETIQIRNGINPFNLPKLKNRINLNPKQEIRLIGLANVRFYHGYDRVLIGLKEYYASNPSVTVYFDIVGSGDLVIQELIEMTNKFNLNKYVVFHGPMIGEALDDIFDKSHLGIGSLANFRANVFVESALKSREYCARGIPFVLSSHDPDFDDFPYSLKVPNNEEPLNIQILVSFVNSRYRVATPEVIRDYALKNLSWDRQLRQVVESIDNRLR